MKNLVILGASRAGKTTLARKINKVYPHYHIIIGDCIRNAFQEELPQNGINKYNGQGMREDFARFSATLFSNNIKKSKGFCNYIFDSCDVSVENALKFFKRDDTIIVFLGYSELNEYQALSNYRKYEKEDDWTCRRTDKELLEHAKTWVNNSKKFKENCELNNVRYVDTSFNRDKILQKLTSELIKELLL